MGSIQMVIMLTVNILIFLILRLDLELEIESLKSNKSHREMRRNRPTQVDITAVLSKAKKRIKIEKLLQDGENHAAL